MISFMMIKTGREAVFIQKDGLFHLPLAYMWIAIASMPTAMIHLNAIERWMGRQKNSNTHILYYCDHVPLLCAIC